MANETEKNYSIKQASEAMGISEATTKAYKATLIKAFEHHPDKILTETRSLNEYGLEQLKEVQKFHKIGAPDGYIAKIQSMFPKPVTEPPNSLANGVANQCEDAVPVSSEVVSGDFIQRSELAVASENKIQMPPGFDPAAMVRYFDGVVGQATDTATLLAIVELATDAAKAAMDQKLASQRELLAKTKHDAKALADKVFEAQLDLKVKALESKILAESQTAATGDAESAFAGLMNMGKPSDTAPPQP